MSSWLSADNMAPGILVNKMRGRLLSWWMKLTCPELINVNSEGLSYLSLDALFAIRQIVRRIERDKVPGIFAEMGCALGGSAIAMALSKKKDRKLFVYDVFRMIPPPSGKDGKDAMRRWQVIGAGASEGIGGNRYYGYENDIKAKVIENLQRYKLDMQMDNIRLIEGLYEETLKIQESVAFAHIDCDWYKSVTTCLKEVVPNLSVGGRIIVDDYYTWEGCKNATDDFFVTRKDKFHFYTVAGKLHIERRGS